MSLKDKVIVITGASSGLGASVAEKVAAEGAQVVLVGRSKDKLEHVETKIKEKKGNVTSYVCDIRDLSQIQTTVTGVLKQFGTIETLRDKLQDTKIKVTGFFPGGFDSDLYESAKKSDAHKQPWMMKTEDVADVVLFALTRPSDVLLERIVMTKVFE